MAELTSEQHALLRELWGDELPRLRDPEQIKAAAAGFDFVCELEGLRPVPRPEDIWPLVTAPLPPGD